MQNVVLTFRMGETWQASKGTQRETQRIWTLEKRITVLEYQNKALREQIKMLMQLYEQDLLNQTLFKLINFEQTIIAHLSQSKSERHRGELSNRVY